MTRQNRVEQAGSILASAGALRQRGQARNGAIAALLSIAVLAGATACRTAIDLPRAWAKGPLAPTDLSDGCGPASVSRWELTFVGNQPKARPRRPHRVRRDVMPYDIDLSGVLLPALLVDPPRPEARRAPYDATAEAEMDDATRRRLAQAARAARRVVVDTSSGWLVGFDGGLNGGSLWWFPPTPGVGRLLWTGPIRFLEAMGTDIVAMSGAGYLDGGVALMLSRHPMFGWTVVVPWMLSSEPTAILTDGVDRMLVGTRRGLLDVRRRSIEPMLDFGFPDAPLVLARSPHGDIAVTFRSHALLLRPAPSAGFFPEWFWLPGCRRAPSDD